MPNKKNDESEARKGKREVDYALDGIHQAVLYDLSLIHI